MKRIIKILNTIFTFPHVLIKEFSFKYAVYCYFAEQQFLNKISLGFICNFFQKKKNEYVYHYLDTTYIDVIQKYKIKKLKESHISNLKIWVFWAQGFEQAPDIVKICYKNLCDKYTDQVTVITMDNYHLYTDIPQYITDKLNQGVITLTHFSDILRLSLLARYGGMWIDATCFVSDGLLEEYNKGGLCTLQSQSPSNSIYISAGRWTIWAIGSNETNCTLFALGRDLLFEYWVSNNVMIDYFLIDYIVDYIYHQFRDVKDMIDNVSIDGSKRFNLINAINNEYNSNSDFCYLLSDGLISKLSYKCTLKDYTAANKPTIYKHLKDLYLN